MKITPHEILYCLGFDVPPEGIEINPAETNLYVESLKALGVTLDAKAIPESVIGNLYTESIRLLGDAIDVSTIPDSLLDNCHSGFAKIVIACQNEELNINRQLDSDVADWLRALVASNLSTMSGRYKTVRAPGAIDLLPSLPRTVTG